ncbi:MAG: type III pantothenate kinase [Planctomycetaceae bacterium]|jgi:type III pantothenate kinase|nr:type III pantothenate kinase [Planctomycetaceae bacterium]
MTPRSELLAVDIGNTRVKIGLYEQKKLMTPDVLPQPEQMFVSPADRLQDLEFQLREFLVSGSAKWVISSVNAESEQKFLDWLKAKRPDDMIQRITGHEFGIPTTVDVPEKVGSDRLCNAKAALCLKDPGEPALVVDLGTAVTLDVLSGDGIFRGGAIIPGFQCAAKGLHKLTSQLPLVDADELRLPEFPAANTVSAIETGIFWGIVGAIRQFLALAHEERPALLILTGGNAYQVWEALLNPHANAKSESMICNADRSVHTSVKCDSVPAKQETDTQTLQEESGFIPVQMFHEVICCPYLTLSGIALCGTGA